MNDFFINEDDIYSPKTKKYFNEVLIGRAFIELFQYDYKESEVEQTVFDVFFIISDQGKLVGERINGKNADQLSEIEEQVLLTLHTMQHWSCGYYKGKPVNVRMHFHIHLDYR